MKTTLIIPVYNFGHRLPKTLEMLGAYFLNKASDIEIILVNDGSTDDTAQVLEGISAPFRVIHNTTNLGKGASIKRGVKEARGEHIFFTDADIPYDMSVMDESGEMLDQGYDIVLGSRNLPGSSSVERRSLVRRASSFVFSQLANLTLLHRIEDTQCGFKGFRSTIGKTIFEKVTLHGFVFDVEVIYLAQKMNAKTGLVPVRLIDDTDSSVRLARDTYRMTRDLLKLFVHTRAPVVGEFVRYAIVGVFNTALNLAIFNSLIWVSGITYGPFITIFSLITFIIVISVSFFLNAIWVFNKRDKIAPSGYARFFLVSGITALVNIAIVHVLVNVVGAPIGISSHAWANIALIGTVVISVLGNFVGYKFFTYR
jgi:dolichyl-phosphate beta-glucosyltransferase